MKCRNCQEEVPEHRRDCVVCGADAGFPNVRAALRDEEINALSKRVKEAEEYADVQNYKDILEKFREAVSGSSAVICRSLAKINELLSSDSELFGTFYQSLSGEARLPEDNEWDRTRQVVDSLLFPYYYEHIRFGSLSINRTGISGYGDYCIVLKEAAIRDRATVFEENSILFIRKCGIVPGDPLPLGYRATWKNRGLLSVAKLGKRLMPASTESEFSNLLSSSSASDADFIEVHIYGPIHRRSIEHLSGPKPRDRTDKVLLKSVFRKLKEIGATAEIC